MLTYNSYYEYLKSTKKRHFLSNLLVLGINTEDPVWFDVLIAN